MIGDLVAARPEVVGRDVGRVRLEDSTLSVIVESPTDDREPSLSPDDGKWLAQTSNISGANEICVRPYTDSGAAVLVSARAGVAAHCSVDGSELVYRAGMR